MTAADVLLVVALVALAPVLAGVLSAVFSLPDLEPVPGWVPVCDICDRPTSTAVVHTHHHDPGCGIDHPARQWCRCDFVLCPSCCPCDVYNQETA